MLSAQALVRLRRESDTQSNQNGPSHRVERATHPRPLQEWSDPMENDRIEREPAERHEAQHQAQWNKCGEAARSRRELGKQAKKKAAILGLARLLMKPGALLAAARVQVLQCVAARCHCRESLPRSTARRERRGTRRQ